MLDIIEMIDVFIVIFFLISVPLFLLPIILAIVGLFKEKFWEFNIILIGYMLAFLYGKIIGFDELFILLLIVYTFFFLSWYLVKNILNTRKIVASISIALSFYIMIGVLNYAPFEKPTPVGNKLTEQQLIKDIKLIVSKKIRVRSVKIWKNGQLTNMTVESKNKDSKIIDVYATIKHEKDNHKQAFEVQQAMKIFLYLKDRKLPYPVDGVHVSVGKEFSTSEPPQVFISRAEFENLYNSLDRDQLNEKELVKRLQETWIEKIHYSSE